jgi:hypothetical protein
MLLIFYTCERYSYMEIIYSDWNESEMEAIEMTDSRENAIKFLAGVVMQNNGLLTDEQKQRQQAVDLLAGRQQQQPLRGPADALAQGIRRNLR